MFDVKEAVGLPNVGVCNNTMQSAKELTWSDGRIDQRYLADKEAVTCLCYNGVGSEVQTSTKLDVQCAYKYTVNIFLICIILFVGDYYRSYVCCIVMY